MVKGAAVLRVLVLSEDTGEQTQPTLEALLKKMFRLVDEHCGTHLCDFRPSDPESRNALRGKANQGANRVGHDRRRLLAGKIATELAGDGFVAYHLDGDCRWSEQRGEVDFPGYTELRSVVAELLRSPPRHGAPAVDPSELLKRFLLIAPYWELEAWLYQNIDVAISLCETHDGGRCVPLFREWAARREAIDEIKDTKNACCLTAKHNQELAKAWPSQPTYECNASFAATVDRLRACQALNEALARTHAASMTATESNSGRDESE